MKKIKFGATLFDLVYDVVREGSKIRVTVIKGEHTLSEVAPVVTGVSEIDVFEDDVLVSMYNGYTTPVALNIYNDYPVGGEGVTAAVISIELENVDFQSQIDAINAHMDSVVETQATHDGAIADLGDELETLAESQETQDLAIEDLAEAVNDLTPEEE